MTFHMVDIETLNDNDIQSILSRAQNFARAYPKPSLNRKIIFNIFMEDSTRTRMSFEVAAKRLGADVVNFSVGSSSLKKGESHGDTFATLAAYKPDAVILRSAEYAAPRYAKTIFGCPVINAGDSWRAHPTQALLDAVTIQQSKGDIRGMKIAICGDIAHSRVARSNYELLTRLGAQVHIVAPELLMPKPSEMNKAKRFTSMEDGLQDVDAIMMLRIQKERMNEGLSGGSDIDFFHEFGLTQERLKLAKNDAIVMHPGPMNRNVEIADDVADDPYKSVILKQVENGVPTRMAVLDYAING
jgi:aspartate carbamoyltransferase catalytic subunit